MGACVPYLFLNTAVNPTNIRVSYSETHFILGNFFKSSVGEMSTCNEVCVYRFSHWFEGGLQLNAHSEWSDEVVTLRMIDYCCIWLTVASRRFESNPRRGSAVRLIKYDRSKIRVE